jgi:hypothetical protein
MNNSNRIGILTLHSGYNEGAILQTFCIATNLQRNLADCKIEIVDHRYPSKVRAYGPARDDKTRVLNDFIDHSLPLSKIRFLADDHRDTFEFIRKNYSAVITGSDELWKLKYSRRFFGLLHEQKDPWRPAFPNVYWPDESIKIPKIAYAVSIGSTDWRNIPRKHLTRMKDILSDYTVVGIRDQRTMSFLKWLDTDVASKAEWVPDPTFSADIVSMIDKEMLKQRLQDWGVDFDRPRICIVLRDSPNINNEIINEIKKQGFQVVSLSLPNSTADVDLSAKGFTPLEWFGVIDLMDFCITQRMHTCISCILHDTPFVAVDFYDNSMDDDTKIKDLMRSFNLLDYYYSVEKDPFGKFQGIIENLLNNPWPVQEIEEKRILFNNRSKEFMCKITVILKDIIKHRD